MGWRGEGTNCDTLALIPRLDGEKERRWTNYRMLKTSRVLRDGKELRGLDMEG